MKHLRNGLIAFGMLYALAHGVDWLITLIIGAVTWAYESKEGLND